MLRVIGEGIIGRGPDCTVETRLNTSRGVWAFVAGARDPRNAQEFKVTFRAAALLASTLCDLESRCEVGRFWEC